MVGLTDSSGMALEVLGFGTCWRNEAANTTHSVNCCLRKGQSADKSQPLVWLAPAQANRKSIQHAKTATVEQDAEMKARPEKTAVKIQDSEENGAKGHSSQPKDLRVDK